MQSSPETANLLVELQSTLSNLLTGATFSEETLQEGGLPVVVMFRQHALICFAIGDQADYQPLYEAFKKHYLSNSAEWSTKDVSFVYCLPVDVEVDADFVSRVEVDVYFCRKYVVRLHGDLGNLSSALARLPFLPLSPITPGVQTRPPSAQTLLRQRNVKADLAKALVVPQISSAPKILSGCIAGTYGSPDGLQSGAGNAGGSQIAEDRVPVTLKSISIRNFRAYRSKKEFTLGSAVTILYGPNGFGKTSFFDAMDFAVTGGVGRLTRATGGLLRAAKHLDSDNDPTEVSLTIVRQGVEHIITRDLADHNNASVDGKQTPRKDVLSLLTGGATAGADRVDSLVSLFRATHLFSQENQELTQDVATKCELSSDLVSRMLAFEDYASGLKKAEEVHKLAMQELRKATSDITSAQLAIQEDRTELARLEGFAASDTSPEILNARFADLDQAVIAEGLSTSGVSSRDTRALRASLEAAAAESVARRNVLSRASRQVGTLVPLQEQLQVIRDQVSERQAEVTQAENNEKEASELFSELSGRLAGLQLNERNLLHRRDRLEWAVAVKPDYDQLALQDQTLSREQAALVSQLGQQRSIVEQAQNTRRESEAVLRQAEAALGAASEKRARFQLIRESSVAWEQNAPKLEALRDTESSLLRSIEDMLKQLEEAQQLVYSQESLVDSAQRALEEARTGDSRLKELISEIRDHVQGSCCQLCGHDHGSVESLLAAIDKRMQHDDRIVRLTKEVSTQRLALQTRMRDRQDLANRLNQEESRHTQAQTHRQQMEQQQADYSVLLNSVGMSLTGETPALLEVQSNEAQEEEQLAAEKIDLTRQSVDAADAALSSAEIAYQSIDRQRQAAEWSRNETQGRMRELFDQANRDSISLADNLDDLIDARRVAQEDSALLTATVQPLAEQVQAQLAVLSNRTVAVTGARASHLQATQALSLHQTSIQEILSELAAMGFDSGISQDELRRQIDVASAREISALRLRDAAAELEVAVDTAATSAAFENIRKRILDNEAAVRNATDRAQSVDPWVRYFNEVRKLLGSQQAFATEHFISEYGPRTATIQQRLRPVYGFGEIEVSSKDSAIGIHVHRKGESLRPTDFFSQSQIQTLVLGLFLTACSSQTWSGFSSVMMDDPVTHFDDLNTYALLDLILGLQSSPEGERQFVISTCDEKLLQLARYKFRHMGSAAKFYRFQAIGAEGPMVTEITV